MAPLLGRGPSRCFNSFYDDDDYEESTIPLNEIVSQIPLSIAITPVLPTLEPEDSLIIGNEELSTIPEKESDEVIKSSVENLVPIPSESEDTFGSDSECDLPSCDDFSPINIPEGKSVTFSNPLFDSNNVKIYSNPLFEFDDEYISSDVNPLFDEMLENIESGDVDVIELLLHRDPSTPKISVASILEGFTDEPPLKKNDDLFDLESKENEWKKILYDDPIDDLMTEEKVFAGILEKFFSPTYVSLPFEDRHYLSLTYVIRIFLPYFTYPVESPFLLSSGSEDTIFDPDISAFHFSSLEPVASHRSGTFIVEREGARLFLSRFRACFLCPGIPDYEDSLARSLDPFVEIPSGESKVHIEVLSVLWGNRLLDHGRLAYRCGSC
ncbi:hypothetical protein Tco_0138066 [Tanacetum coccineum]